MGARILVVDDEEDIVRLIQSFLSSGGFEVETALSPLQAIARVKAGAADCVLTDMQLPELSGIELLKRVKEHSGLIPVILMSGRATEMSKSRARELGAYDFLEKPVGKDTLVQCVKNALAEAQKKQVIPKLLVADDHADIHKFFNDVLKNDGYELRFVEDGRKAVDAVLREDFDMVFMDINMPDKNGIEAAREIKEKKPGTFVVMMTGEAEETEIKEALAVGAGYDAILRKPFQVSTLRLIVQNLFPEKEKYMEDVEEQKRRAARGAGEILRDGIVEQASGVSETVQSRSFKQWTFVVVISVIMSLVILNVFLPLTEVVSKAPGRIFEWMQNVEGYLQRDEQRELQQK